MFKTVLDRSEFGVPRAFCLLVIFDLQQAADVALEKRILTRLNKNESNSKQLVAATKTPNGDF